MGLKPSPARWNVHPMGMLGTTSNPEGRPRAPPKGKRRVDSISLSLSSFFFDRAWGACQAPRPLRPAKFVGACARGSLSLASPSTQPKRSTGGPLLPARVSAPDCCGEALGKHSHDTKASTPFEQQALSAGKKGNIATQTQEANNKQDGDLCLCGAQHGGVHGQVSPTCTGRGISHAHPPAVWLAGSKMKISILDIAMLACETCAHKQMLDRKI